MRNPKFWRCALAYSCLSGSKAAEYQFVYSFLSYLCGSGTYRSVIQIYQSLLYFSPEYTD